MKALFEDIEEMVGAAQAAAKGAEPEPTVQDEVPATTELAHEVVVVQFMKTVGIEEATAARVQEAGNLDKVAEARSQAKRLLNTYVSLVVENSSESKTAQAIEDTPAGAARAASREVQGVTCLTVCALSSPFGLAMHRSPRPQPAHRKRTPAHERICVQRHAPSAFRRPDARPHMRSREFSRACAFHCVGSQPFACSSDALRAMRCAIHLRRFATSTLPSSTTSSSAARPPRSPMCASLPFVPRVGASSLALS